MLTSKLSQTLKIKLKIFSKSNWKEGIMGLTTHFWRDERWFLVHLLFCFVVSISSFPYKEARLLKMLIPLRLEAKRATKIKSDTGREIFCRRLLYVLDARCPSLHLICCRNMDSDCWFISEISSENFWHYFLHFWESILLWCQTASPSRCVIIGNASSGRQQSLWPSWCLGHSEPRLDTFLVNWSIDQSRSIQY